MKIIMKKLNYYCKNLGAITVVIILIVSTLIKVFAVSGNNFAFTMDQGRDMTDIRQMVVTHTPRLVGPTTSINGVLLGPFWYYFNLPPFLAFGGNPAAIVFWQILWYQVSVVILWLVLKRKSISLATIIAIFLLLMPTGFNTARYFWNANSMTFFTIIYLASLIVTVRNTTKKNLLVLGLVSGLAMQVEVAFGILFFPFALLYLLIHKTGFKKILSLIIGFGLTLLPQVLFELRHGFIMTKVLLNEFAGKGDMLGEKISLVERFNQRWDHLHTLLLRSSHLPPNTIMQLFALSLLVFIFIVIKKKAHTEANRVWLLSFCFVVFTAIFYLLFPQKLKGWYTLGLSIPLAIFLSSFLNYLYENKSKLLKVITMIILISTVYYSVKSQTDYLRDVASKPSNDPSNLQNEITDLNWVYQEAAGQGFNLYSYIPSVYDYPNQHVFWWYGTQKYGYQPSDISYLPNQPEYIIKGDLAWTKRKSLSENQLTFLIIEKDREMPQREQAWLGNFSKLCLVKQHSFPWNAEVRMLSKCN